MRRPAFRIAFVAALVGVKLVSGVLAQDGQRSQDFVRQLTDSKYGILSNSVANLHANGDELWVGPYLNFTQDGGRTWKLVESDSLFGSANRLFSIDVDAGVIVAGLGRSDNTTGDNVQTAAGFLISGDNGHSFSYRFPQLDRPDDNSIRYGVSLLDALPIIVPQQSPPFDVDYDPVRDEIWVAGWASGIRRSTDRGRTWSRVVLPPDDLDYIHPDSSYSFTLEPQRGGTGSLNHMGFSVLVDDSGTVWAGTAGGLNRSLDEGQSWRRFRSDGTSNSLTGSWVISIEEQLLAGRSTIWMATWVSTEGSGSTFGVTYTRDGGETFVQALHGERIYDFGFDGPTVYAAGDNGLFVSRDGGIIWESIREFRDRSREDAIIRPDSKVFSVEVTNDAVWIGTEDGLLRSDDGAASWELFRVNIPVHPDQPSARVPDVEAFAYPNPFSPAADSFIRIRYELSTASDVEIRIFDFGMNLMRILVDRGPSGISETLWDGMDRNGVRVANGAYFYEVRAGGSRFRGKILVIE